MSSKVMIELEWEQIDSITTNSLKEARDYLNSTLELNKNNEDYFRVYFSAQEDPDGSKDRAELIKMINSFNDVLNYFGSK